MEKTDNFKSLEEESLIFAFNCGIEYMKKKFEAIDSELRENRNKKSLRHCGKKEKTIGTTLGTVTIQRNSYRDRDTGKMVYLLDDYLGLEKKDFASPLLCETVAKLICTNSYRTTAETISGITGISISHGEIWNIVQSMGQKADDLEKKDAAKAKKNEGSGEVVTNVLFEEQDGIYLKLQGKDRQKYGSDKEMKIAIAHDGWIKTGKERYNLSNKIAVASFESVDKFFARKEGAIAANFDVDEIKLRVLNADGAEWMKRSITGEDVLYQLDPYHRNKAIIEKVPDKEVQKEMFKMLYGKDIDSLLDYIEALSNSVDDEKQAEKYNELHRYFANNKEALIAYKRRGIEIPEPPEGKEYRQCGTMESNVYTIIGNRMKGRRACWSIRGGDNLAKILTLNSTDNFDSKMPLLTSAVRYEVSDNIADITTTAAKVPERVGKGYNGCQSSSIPNVPWLKDMLGFKSLSEIKL